jgi:hypothetical protein
MTTTTPDDNPTTDDFWALAAPIPAPPALPPTLASALERLGPSPFPKSGFPFLGFLATVYDQVAAHVPAATDPAP